jgi:hypothetical protein
VAASAGCVGAVLELLVTRTEAVGDLGSFEGPLRQAAKHG